MTKKFLFLTSALLAAACGRIKEQTYPINPVAFTSVEVTDSFWGERLKVSREVTIPLAFSKCEETGRYRNFIQAREQMESPGKNLGFPPSGFSFDDTDVYKTIEGASYVLQTMPDGKLEAYIDSILTIVAAAQEPDGYLYTPRTMNPEHPHPWAGESRWSSEEVLSHELYNLGHMVEGAVAHWQATGKTLFLDIARRYADCVVKEVGPSEGQACVIPGHQIAEMALCRLYLATGEKKYLDQAKFFLDMRGRTAMRDRYNQSHLPVLEQKEAVGHAVRATYMYAGMADVAALTGDKAYIDAIDTIWENIVTKKLYITGGIGAVPEGEAFGPDYYLPCKSAYCETCAAIGFVYMNYRMFLLHGDSKYYDVLERTLYNGLISGVSSDGGAFFYPNPMESHGEHLRQPWFGCACCPSNLCRFIPSVPGYVYAVKDRDLYVNLYLSNNLTVKVDGKEISLSQQSGYPWNGDSSITIGSTCLNAPMTLKLRIPGWVKGSPVPGDLYSYSDGKHLSWSASVNGEELENVTGKDGYLSITRKWSAGDRVDLHFDMEMRTVKASDKVEACRGLHAQERGPIVYCNERPLDSRDNTLIPYYSWNNRGPAHMNVWLKD